jgi:acetyl esterase/lipase
MWMWDNYTTDPKERKEFMPPLQATRNQLKGCRCIVVQTAQNDILRDEEGVCMPVN